MAKNSNKLRDEVESKKDEKLDTDSLENENDNTVETSTKATCG